ncbi:hypothetical protein, partial [Burkholderia pseudomallei]|uniref:hypothetical protein n=1 Tax=Burkholderia pseudomallei TaxID=28450 RepID=UPI002932BD34
RRQTFSHRFGVYFQKGAAWRRALRTIRRGGGRRRPRAALGRAPAKHARHGLPGLRTARGTAERRPEDGRRPPAPRERAATCADHGFVVETL